MRIKVLAETLSCKTPLLFISTQLPSLRVPQAGQKIAYSNLISYAEKYDVYLISSLNEFEKKFISETDYRICKEYFFYRVDNFKRIFHIMTNPLVPIRAAVKANGKVIQRIADLQKHVKFDLVHFEFTAAAYYMNYIDQNARKIVIEHDVTYQSIERKKTASNLVKRFFYTLEYMRQKKWEIGKLLQTDEIITLNQKDKDILVKDGVPPWKIKINEPDINPIFKNVQRTQIEKHTILFWGALNRNENVDAVLWFVNHIFPVVLEKYENAKLYVVGTSPPTEILQLSSEKIMVTGFVKNPVPYFEKSEVAVAPLRIGAGIKVKVLEYLEAGVPVVSTSVGAEGIENDSLILADDSIKFANAIIRLFKKEEPTRC